MKFLRYGIRQGVILLALCSGALAAAACLSLPGPAAPATPLPSETPTQSLPTGAPTTTPVWFPPTPTFTPFPTQEITPTLDARPQAGELFLSDDFSDTRQWSLGRTASTSAALGDGYLTLALSQPEAYIYSLRQGTELKDFYLEITASPSLCRGADEYGLLLRVSKTLEFYRFSLTCDGQLRLDKYFGGRASSPQPLEPSGSVPRGAPSDSRLGVWALGSDLRFYINGDFQFSLHDPSLPSGGIGVFARSGGENAVSISFSDLEIRKATK